MATVEELNAGLNRIRAEMRIELDNQVKTQTAEVSRVMGLEFQAKIDQVQQEAGNLQQRIVDDAAKKLQEVDSRLLQA